MKKELIKILAVLALAGIFLACKGPSGSTGPSSNTGPQAQTGSISGHVMFYAIKPGVDVNIVVDLGGGGKLEAKTNDKGYYILEAVPVGTDYTVTASKDGYQSKTTSRVKVDPNTNTSVNFLLLIPLKKSKMAVSTPKEYIETVLPGKLTEDKIGDMNISVQFNITGDAGGDWNLVIKDKKAVVESGVMANPTISLKMKDVDFMRMVNGEISGERAFITGKLKFKGSMTAGLTLQKLGII